MQTALWHKHKCFQCLERERESNVQLCFTKWDINSCTLSHYITNQSAKTEMRNGLKIVTICHKHTKTRIQERVETSKLLSGKHTVCVLYIVPQWVCVFGYNLTRSLNPVVSSGSETRAFTLCWLHWAQIQIHTHTEWQINAQLIGMSTTQSCYFSSSTLQISPLPLDSCPCLFFFFCCHCFHSLSQQTKVSVPCLWCSLSALCQKPLYRGGYCIIEEKVCPCFLFFFYPPTAVTAVSPSPQQVLLAHEAPPFSPSMSLTPARSPSTMTEAFKPKSFDKWEGTTNGSVACSLSIALPLCLNLWVIIFIY